jgi:phosphate transport system permease protein
LILFGNRDLKLHRFSKDNLTNITRTLTLFSQCQSLASLIANEFNEASSNLQLSALIGLGAVLLILTMGINIGARVLVSRMVKVSQGGRE